MIVLEDELDDLNGDQPYEESPGVWICRRCASEIYHRSALCRHCKRADTLKRKKRRGYQLENADDE